MGSDSEGFLPSKWITSIFHDLGVVVLSMHMLNRCRRAGQRDEEFDMKFDQYIGLGADSDFILFKV